MLKIDYKQVKLFETDKEKVTRQFQLLEQKIGSLIKLTDTLKQEKGYLIERLRVQEETLNTLSKELTRLKIEKERDEHRLSALLKQVPK
jgi:chromosome segregation ATPase